MTQARQLVIDIVPPDFRPGTHVALGPWCFFGVEDAFPDWDSLPFIDPFPTVSERNAGGRTSRAVAYALFDRLWPLMNQRHRTDYSREFWRAVLMDWLIYLVMLSWRWWCHVEAFIAQAGSESFEVPLVTAADPLRFASTLDFVVACTYHSEFRSWLISEIVRRLAPPHWRLYSGRQLQPAPPSPPAPPAHRRRQAVEHVARMILRGARIARVWERVFSAYVDLLPRRPKRLHRMDITLPPDLPPAFLDFVAAVAHSTLPESLSEGFAALDAEAARQRYRAGRLYVTWVNPHDDQGNIILGHAEEAGERVVAMQHGGVNGWAAVDWLFASNEYTYDTFASWGWIEQEDYEGRFVPLTSPLLSSSFNLARRPGDDIIFVGAFMYGVTPRFDCFPVLLDYRKWKRRFIAGLSQEAANRLRYRPYPFVLTHADADWLRRFFPGLRTLEGSLLRPLFASRLVVLDHPSTTLCITMGANIPTIGFWDKDAWPLARQAVPLFAEMEAVGVFFTDPEAAAAQVNEIWHRVEEWWREPARQHARARWCEQFARTKRYWWLHWWKELAAI